MAPMGAILMPELHITPAQFGLAVSVYAFGAGASGIIASGFADRFDRKRFLIFFYSGFLIGTLFCALAPSYGTLVAARLITGLFAGVIGSIVLAIVADLFPYAARGRVMGIIQTAFATSQILGLPAGLYLATHFGWHWPFLLIVCVGVVAGIVILLKLRPVDAHLRNRVDRHPLHHLGSILTNRYYMFALSATIFLSMGGFMLMPFTSAFAVHNLGISFDHLPLLYLAVGSVTFFTGPLVGQASDRFGKFRMFWIGSIITSVMVMIYTNLDATPILVVAVISSLLFFGIFSRMIPAQALLSAVPTADNRGGFMALSSSMQQFSGGIASVVAGHIVTEGPGGRIEHFPVLGIILVITAVVTVIQMFFINRSVLSRAQLAHEKEVPVELQAKSET
jgi:predicted MFS family arabinose efflux permease